MLSYRIHNIINSSMGMRFAEPVNKNWITEKGTEIKSWCKLEATFQQNYTIFWPDKGHP